MILDIEKALIDLIKSDVSSFDDGYVYDPNRNIDSLTRPFFIVRVMSVNTRGLAFIDTGASAGSDQLKQEDYLFWIYVYTRNHVLEMRDLPEEVKVAVYKDLTVNGSVYRVEDIFLDYVGSTEETNLLDRNLTVLTGVLTHYREVS